MDERVKSLIELLIDTNFPMELIWCHLDLITLNKCDTIFPFDPYLSYFLEIRTENDRLSLVVSKIAAAIIGEETTFEAEARHCFFRGDIISSPMANDIEFVKNMIIPYHQNLEEEIPLLQWKRENYLVFHHMLMEELRPSNLIRRVYIKDQEYINKLEGMVVDED